MKLIGLSEGFRGKWKDRQNVCLGIAILRKYRGHGLGETLLRRIITLTKKNLKPKNIYLDLFAKNKIACALYKKIGFREFARFPKWFRHRGKDMDKVYMILK